MHNFRINNVLMKLHIFITLNTRTEINACYLKFHINFLYTFSNPADFNKQFSIILCYTIFQ